jgi:hypothetical protein
MDKMIPNSNRVGFSRISTQNNKEPKLMIDLSLSLLFAYDDIVTYDF